MSRVVEKILEILQMQAENTVDLIDTVFSDRPTFYRKTKRFFKKGPKEFKGDWADIYRQRQIFYSTLNKLKREGLVLKKKDGVISRWIITNFGKKRLIKLKKDGANEKDKPVRRRYEIKPSNSLTIVSFDVPERERKKRDWLRINLFNFGFSQLQKSVWMGRVGLPPAFLTDLKFYGLISCVHIFSVDKGGTISKSI